VGTKGRDANVALTANDKGFAPIVSYSMAKGAYIGVSLEGQAIAVRGDCNEDFYGKKATVTEIFDLSVQAPPNDDLAAISAMLNSYIGTPEKPADLDELWLFESTVCCFTVVE